MVVVFPFPLKEETAGAVAGYLDPLKEGTAGVVVEYLDPLKVVVVAAVVGDELVVEEEKPTEVLDDLEEDLWAALELLLPLCHVSIHPVW
jgi:hypothetical protein